MLLAMEAVNNGTPIQCAARLHGVPRSTLRNRISGRVEHGRKPGPSPYLSNAEAGCLCNSFSIQMLFFSRIPLPYGTVYLLTCSSVRQ